MKSLIYAIVTAINVIWIEIQRFAAAYNLSPSVSLFILHLQLVPAGHFFGMCNHLWIKRCWSSSLQIPWQEGLESRSVSKAMVSYSLLELYLLTDTWIPLLFTNTSFLPLPLYAFVRPSKQVLGFFRMYPHLKGLQMSLSIFADKRFWGKKINISHGICNHSTKNRSYYYWDNMLNVEF